MKLNRLLAMGFCGSLMLTTTAADESGETALHSASASADKAVAAEEKGDAEPVVSRGRVTGPAAGKPKRADTGTAAGHIHNQVKKGNVKIQGATDADIYD
jgi:hypothetical protein